MKRMIGILLAMSLLLAGCGPRQTAPEIQGQSAPAESVTVPEDLTALFSDRDYETGYEKCATITLNGSAASCDSNAVQISGSTVTITDEGSYRIQGNLDDGQIIVNADKQDKTQLILDGVSVHSETSAPLYILQADKVFVTLQGENTLSNGGSFVAIDDNNIDAVLFSKEDVTLNGTGDLTITSPSGHGIVSKDELTVTGGSYNLTTASHGIAGKDNVCIDGGTFTIAAGKDGIHSENDEDPSLGFVYIKSGSFTISAEGDGISAAAWMQIENGQYEILTGGGWENGQQPSSENWGGMGGGMGPGGMGPGGMMPGGMGGKPGRRDAQVTSTASVQPVVDTASEDSTSIKGIKAGGNLVINGGTFSIDSADDGIHADGDLSVAAGSFSVATGDDGIHAEGTLQITGGTATISQCYEGLEALHIQLSGGDITLTATDDGLNAAGGMDQSGMGGRDPYDKGGRGPGGGMGAGGGSIVISGGKLHITASGDGIDANGSLQITGGHTTVCGPTYGDTATLDYDTTATIEGGTFLGSGAMGMAQSFSDSSQGVIALRGSGTAGTQITVTDSSGKELVRFAPEMEFALLILSTPELQKGESYTVAVGDQSGQFQAS